MESSKDQIVYPSMVSNLAARAKTIFAGDLSYFCTEDDLYRLFSPAGTIVNVSIARKSDTSLMYGFVEFESSEKADQITADFNGQMFMGRNLRIFALANYTGPASSFPNNKPESFCVHVSFVTHNLHKLIDEEYLREVFNSFGDVFDVAIRRYYRQRQRQYGYAFVDFLSKQSAITAAESWQEKDHDGVCIKCTLGHRVTGNDDSPPKNSVERVDKHKSSNQNRAHRKDGHYNNNYYTKNQEQEINVYPNQQLPMQTPFPVIPQMMPEMMAYPMPNPMMFPPGSMPPMAMAPHYFAPYNPAPVPPVPFHSANTTSKAPTSDAVFVPPPMMTQSPPMVTSASAIPVQQQFYPYFQNSNFAPATGSPQTTNLNTNQHQMHSIVSSSPGGGSVNSSNTPNTNHNPNSYSKNISNETGNNGPYGQYATQPANYVPSHFVPQQTPVTNSNTQYNKTINGNTNYPTMNNSSNYPNAGINIYPGANFTMQLPPPQYVLPPPHQQNQVAAYATPNNPHMYTLPPTVNYT